MPGNELPVDDDRGPNLLTVFVDPPDPKPSSYVNKRRSSGSPVPHSGSKKPVDRCWMAIWLPPPGIPNAQKFVFSVTLADHTQVVSAPFSLGDVSSNPPGTVPPSDPDCLKR